MFHADAGRLKATPALRIRPLNLDLVREPLIPRHGGYRNLKSFQAAQLVYDLTWLFCDTHVNKYSRTRDQMVQAARSGMQNIAEGSQASATSKAITTPDRALSRSFTSQSKENHVSRKR